MCRSMVQRETKTLNFDHYIIYRYFDATSFIDFSAIVNLLLDIRTIALTLFSIQLLKMCETHVKAYIDPFILRFKKKKKKEK